MAGMTTRRCCPRSPRSLCRSCIKKLPRRLRANLASTWDDADLLGYAYATDAALLYLESLRPNKPAEVST
jgi:hypothetical protein